MKTPWSINRLLVVAATFLVVFANFAFFRNVAPLLAGDPLGLLHGASLAAILWAAMVLLLAAFSQRMLVRPFLALMFCVAAVSAYFMDSFNVLLDSGMIRNALETDQQEVADLLTWRLGGYLLLLGVLPSVMMWRLPLRRTRAAAAVKSRLALAGVALAVMVVAIFSSGPFLATFVREHKAVRYYSNPLTPIYSAYRLATSGLHAAQHPLAAVGTDAAIPVADPDRELVVLVVGETARADRFSLNGYSRDTNPELAARDVISFQQVEACGTSTAVSVPCMFAFEGGGEFEVEEADANENVLDVLRHAGVTVLWRDNNSGSKGVAARVPEEDFRNPERNPLCDLECRDLGMLAGLQEYVDRQPEGDILIVLHQMGSHGPAYYKRYPSSFRVFQPTCDSEQLQDCSDEQIGNSYDNSIRYTDAFLAAVVDFLRTNDSRFETAMMYVGDHGESLGENGVYLHGLPRWLAPEAQLRVPLILWFGRNYDDVDAAAVRSLSDAELSHDNVFHTLLGLFEVQSSIYESRLDLLQQSRDLAGKPQPYGG